MSDNVLVRIEYEAKDLVGEHVSPLLDKTKSTKECVHWRTPKPKFKYELKFIKFTELFDNLSRYTREKIIKYILTSIINNEFLENEKSEPKDLILRIDFTASRLMEDGIVTFDDVRINFTSWSHIDTLPELINVAYANGEDLKRSLTSI